MKKILHELYYGRLVSWERGRAQDPEYTLINRKISDIKIHFKNSMSPEEWERFEELENQCSQSSAIEEREAFSYGFTLGVLLMMNVLDFMDERLTDKEG